MKKQNNQKNELVMQASFAIILACVYWIISLLNEKWFWNRLGMGDISDSYFFGFILGAFATSFFGFLLGAFVTIILYKALFHNNDTDKE